jgi:dihydrodipicolinate synthase/N-acetylneuraminate lyase
MIDNLGWADQVKSDYGMKAFMCFIGNYAPKKTAELATLFLEGKFEQWAEKKKKALAHRGAIQTEILSMVHVSEGQGEVYTLAEGTLAKTACELVGRPAGPPFPPQFELSPQQRGELKEKLEGMGLLPLGFS